MSESKAYEPEAACVGRESVSHLFDAVAELPGRQREAIGLRLAGLPTGEITEILACSRDAFYALVHRAVERLRELLCGTTSEEENAG